MQHFLWLTLLQIVLESLPVSSSGHLTLLERMCGGSWSASTIWHSYDQMLHAATCVVIIIYLSMRFDQVKKFLNIKMVFHIFIVDVITALFYLFFLYVPFQFPLAIGFSISAWLLVSAFFLPHEKGNKNQLNWLLTFALGMMQGISLLPGISRLGSTYVVSRWFGLAHPQAFMYSLLIQLPLIGAASVKSMGMGLYRGWLLKLISLQWVVVVLISIILAYIMLLTVNWLGKKKLWWLFGIYLLIPMIISLYI